MRSEYCSNNNKEVAPSSRINTRIEHQKTIQHWRVTRSEGRQKQEYANHEMAGYISVYCTMTYQSSRDRCRNVTSIPHLATGGRRFGKSVSKVSVRVFTRRRQRRNREVQHSTDQAVDPWRIASCSLSSSW